MSASAGLRLDLHRIEIPFRHAFRHSSAERSRTQAIWVEARIDGFTGVGEGCPREYVTGESLDSAAEFVARQRDGLRAAVSDLEGLAAWARERHEAIDANPAAWCAIELAVLDALARRAGVPVEALIGLPPPTTTHRYTAVIGDGDLEAIRGFALRYAELGFRDFKLKLSGDRSRDRERIAALAALDIERLRLRVDANNLWEHPDPAADHLLALGHPLVGIEEPLRAFDFDGMRALAERTGTPIIVDESFLRREHVEPIRDDPANWIVNIRVSKMGGLLRSLDALEEATRAGLGVVVGAQVGETSVLTRAALPVASAAGSRLVGQEGAFGTMLLESDVADPPLVFARGGALDAGAYRLDTGSGWGLSLRDDRQVLLRRLSEPDTKSQTEDGSA